MIHPREASTNRFHLFEQLIDIKPENSLLDFGGNRGNLLHFSDGKINEHSYTSVDVSLDGINMGREEFPNANFVYYDRWNSMYNHSGKETLEFPDIDKNQDYIFSFSVFTHTDFKEFKRTLEWMNTFNYKRMAHSLLDLRCEGTVRWFYNKRVQNYGSCVDITKYVKDTSVHILYLYDNDKVVINQEEASSTNSNNFVVFYDCDWLKTRLSEFNVTIKKPTPDLHPFVVIDS